MMDRLKRVTLALLREDTVGFPLRLTHLQRVIMKAPSRS
jgi:hypothetical protein